MARMFGRWRFTKTIAETDETMFQIRVAADERVVVHACEVIPMGTSGATPPLLFDWLQQGVPAGSFTDASSEIEKVEPACVEALSPAHFSIWKRNATGNIPSSVPGGQVDRFGQHQQSPRVWTDKGPYHEAILPGGAAGTNWGLVHIGAAPAFAIHIVLRLEV